MSRYALIYRTNGLMPQSFTVEANSRADIVLPQVSEDAFLEHIIDFSSQSITRVGVLADGRLIVIPEGEWGANTPSEYFDTPVFYADMGSEE